jgi:D-lactate dehydrogenase
VFVKLLVYSARDFEIPYLKQANQGQHSVHFTEEALDPSTAFLAKGYDAISIFSADDACSTSLSALNDHGVKYISLRSVGYDNVDLPASEQLNIRVANVPAYSPYAIAEHAVSLMLALNRHLIEAHKRVRKYNFKLDGLEGFDLYQKTIGIVGTGKIGSVVAKIMHGFECTLLGYDLKKTTRLENDFNMTYTGLKELCRQSDIISLHVPLNYKTKGIIDKELIQQMKKGVILINTARGRVIDTRAVLDGLQGGRIGALGLDVYENESGIFFKDRSQDVPEDPLLTVLNSLPNVLITGHQAFLTKEALSNIAETTINNLDSWQSGHPLQNEISSSH